MTDIDAMVANLTEQNYSDQIYRLTAQITAVRALHAPMTWHEECMTADESVPVRYAKTYGWCLVKHEDHFAVGDEGLWTCPPRRIADRCVACTPEYDPQEGVIWPCATITALDGAS